MKLLISLRIVFFAIIASLFLASCCKIKTVAPAQGSEVVLHTPIQLKYIHMPSEERRVYFADKACRKELCSEGFWPKPVVLEWSTSNDCHREFTVTLSTSPDFTDGTCIVYTTKEKQLEVTNLMIATTYYWKVQCERKSSAVSSFVTEDVAPRLLRIPKVWNTRDIGGRIGLDGRRVKQNMIIRTGGLNNNAVKVYYTMEEIESNPMLRRHLDEAKLGAELLKNAPKKKLPFLLNGEWTAFLPAMESFSVPEWEMIDALTGIPESFLGAAPQKVAAKDNCLVDLGKFRANLPALLMMDFEAPEDGIMPFTCGADWFWYLRLNGVTLYDRRDGNAKTPMKDNYMLFLPVKKGHNLLSVFLGSGSTSFTWYCAPVPEDTDLDAIISSALKESENTYDVATKQGKRDENGKILYRRGTDNLNDEGRDYLVNTLGLKSEIDLRSDTECSGITVSPVGESVKWFHVATTSYGGIQGESGRESTAKLFRLFLDEENYPINFHCIAGQDRTGTMAFIINALLGVCENELLLDWESSGFWSPQSDFRHDVFYDKMIEGFQKWPGKTIHEKVESYILSLGFTKEDIEHLRDIMLEK